MEGIRNIEVKESEMEKDSIKVVEDTYSDCALNPDQEELSDSEKDRIELGAMFDYSDCGLDSAQEELNDSEKNKIELGAMFDYSDCGLDSEEKDSSKKR